MIATFPVNELPYINTIIFPYPKLVFLNLKSATFYLIVLLQLLKKAVVFHNCLVQIFLPNLTHLLRKYEVILQLFLMTIHLYIINKRLILFVHQPPFCKVSTNWYPQFLHLYLWYHFTNPFLLCFVPPHFLHSILITSPLLLVFPFSLF